MIVLALDTALNACSAAVVEGDRVLAARAEPMARGHQERLAPLVAELMREAALGFEALDRIGVTIGPGSFTGVRVGLAFAKGLSLALDRPCVGIGALEALAATAGGDGLVAAAIDAKRDQLYLQIFRDGEALSDPEALAIEAANERLTDLSRGWPLTFVGSGAPLLARNLPDARVDPAEAPDPAALARLAAARAEPDARPRPLYLRPPDAKTIAERTTPSA